MSLLPISQSSQQPYIFNPPTENGPMEIAESHSHPERQTQSETEVVASAEKLTRKRGQAESKGSITKSPEKKRAKTEGDSQGPHYLDAQDFSQLLQQAHQEADPFLAFTNLITVKEGHWTCFIELDSGACVECQLAFDKWDTTTFGEERPGLFRFIEVFEHDRETGITEEKQLVSIRIDEGHHEGEWLWINRGKHISGRESKAIAEEISRAMGIETCYLADTAKVPASDGKRDIYISVIQQVISGRGYYSPLFSLAHTEKPILSAFTAGEDKKPLYYKQNVDKHQKELKWLRNLKISKIYENILKGSPQEQEELVAILERNKFAPRNAKKDAEWILKSRLSLQDMMKTLYMHKNDGPQALSDYEWAHFTLLDATHIEMKSYLHNRYIWITEKLFFNRLLSASVTWEEKAPKN